VKIDDRVEPLVRKTLNAAVKRDIDRLDAALRAFPDEEARRKGLELATAITVAVLHDSHDGKPTPEQVRQAASVFEGEDWSGITLADAEKYLTTVLAGGSLAEAFDPEAPVVLTFVIAAGLLASSSKVREDEWWFDYLDRIEARLEATPS
jgi:hypothetical protein